MADAKTLNKRKNRRKAAKEAPKEPAKEAKARRNKRKERKKGPKTPKARQQERDADSKGAQKERDTQTEDQEQAPKQAQTPATPQADAGREATDQDKDPSKANAKGPQDPQNNTNVFGVDPKEPFGPIAGPLTAGQEAVDKLTERIFEGPPVAQAESMSTDVPTQYVLHKQWQQTPLGQGAGDYSTYGEAFSPERLHAAVETVANTIQSKAPSAAVTFTVGLALQFAPDVLKAIPGLGDVIGILDGVLTLGNFDIGAMLGRGSTILNTEAWDDDPWGTMADAFMLTRDGLTVLGGIIDLTGGILGVLKRLIDAPVAAAGSVAAAVPEATVSKGAAAAAAGYIATTEMPLIALDALKLSISLAKVGCAGAAASCRIISTLTQDGDAQQIAQTLDKLEGDTGALVGDAGLALMSTISNFRKYATSGTKDAPKDKTPSPTKRLAPLPAKLSKLSLPQGDASGAGTAQRVGRWAQAEDTRNKTWSIFGTWSHNILNDQPSMPFVESFKHLPESPHEPAHIDSKRAELHHLEGQKEELQLWLPQIHQKEAEAEQHKAISATAAAKGLQHQQALEPVDQQLQAKQQAQNKAKSVLATSEADQAKAADSSKTQAEVMAQLKKFLAFADSVPAVLIPARIAGDLKKVKGLVAGQNGEQNTTDTKGEKSKGKAQMERSAQSLDQAQQQSAKEHQRGKDLQTDAEQLNTQAQTRQTALAQQKQKAEADTKAVKTRIEQLNSEVKEAEQSMEAWANVHEATAAQNDLIADVLIDGAEIRDDGTQQTLSQTQESHIRAAMDDTSDCIMFCRRCLSEGATLVNDRSGGLLEGIERVKGQGLLGLPAGLGRGAAGVATEGIEDLEAIRAELSQITPENYAEVLGKAFDTTGRIRKRLKLRPKADKGFGDIKLPTPEIPDPTPEEPKPAPKPPAPAPTAVFFSHNQPTPGVGKGPVLAPEKAGQSKKALQDYTAYFSQGRGGSVNMVGFASVEGSKAHNEQLAARRIDFVEGSLTGADVQTNRSLSVSALVEGEGSVNEPGTPAFDEADGGGYEHSFWRKVTLEVGQEPEFEKEAASETSEVG